MFFQKKKAFMLLEQTNFNKYAIKLENDKQLLYRQIYSLGPIELKILKAYIETNLTTGFICLYKSLAGISIMFDKKPNNSFCLYVNY